MACPASRWWGSPKPRRANRASGYAPRSPPAASIFRHGDTVNLAPADLPKDSGRFDLPIALGILAASGKLPASALEGYEFAGELSLSGELRAVHGVLPISLGAAGCGRPFVLPSASAGEAVLCERTRVLAARKLLEVYAHLKGDAPLEEAPPIAAAPFRDFPYLADIRGQAPAKRALEIAAAGGHSRLISGPPGTGKSMLAQRLPGILPKPDKDQALARATIHSIAGLGFDPSRWRERPFRAPHHTASAVALAGGGALAKSASPTEESCFSMSCRSSTARSWKCCASFSKPAAYTQPVPADAPLSRLVFIRWRR